MGLYGNWVAIIDGVLKNPVAMTSARGPLDGPITGLVRSFALHFSAKAVAALGLMKEAGTLQLGIVLSERRPNGGKTAASAMEVELLEFHDVCF